MAETSESVLSPDQVSRIENLYQVFKEVDPASLDDWVGDFEKDYPGLVDREIKVWEWMARRYEEQSPFLGSDARKELYGNLLDASGTIPLDD